MEPLVASRRLALMTLAMGGIGACSGAAADNASQPPCPDLVGHKARFIGPHDAVTMDYDPDRVNIYHDEDFVITKVTWG